MMHAFLKAAAVVSQWSIPTLVLVIVLHGWWKRIPLYECFVTGAKEGFNIAVMIIPYLVGILSVVAVFRASGALGDITHGLAWLMTKAGMGSQTDKLELLPLAFIRPLSGSGARGMMFDIFKTHGTDSFLGYAATVMQGSTETTFYVLTVYFGAVNIKRLRHTVPACLIADLVGLVMAIVIASIFYYGGR